MLGTRHITALAIGLVFALPASLFGDGGGLFARKQRTDPARVRQLLDIVQTSQDAKKRMAAVAELAAADPRLQTDVIPTIVVALRKDVSPAVRAAAAELIGRYNVAYPTAGLALEDAVEKDPSPVVRDAAQQALWEYHLLGYRSARGANGVLGQTVEPPLAQPAREPGPVTSEPPTALAAQGAVSVPTPTIAPLPPIGPAPGPRVAPGLVKTGNALATVPPHPNLTVEPPLARSIASTATTPRATAEPPIRFRWPEPVSTGKAPPLALNLPPIVTNPGPIPGVTPFPDPTGEPPIARSPLNPGR